MSSLSLASNDEYEKASSLIKDATKFKKAGDLQKAINLIEEAIELQPSVMEFHFKLARYLREDNRSDEAFSVYRRLSLQLPQEILVMRNMYASQLAEEMAKHCYSERKFGYYIYYNLDHMWNLMLGLAVQGRFRGIPDNPIYFGASTKIRKALKALQIEHHVADLSKNLSQFLQEHEASLTRLSEISASLRNPSVREAGLPISGYTSGERQSAALRRDEEFMEIYNKVDGPVTGIFFERDIQPLIDAANDSK